MTEQPFTRIQSLREADGHIAIVPIDGFDGFAVPRRFIARSELISLEVEVDGRGVGHCRVLEVRAGDGEAISTESLRRVSVPKLVKQAVAGAARIYAPVEDGGPPIFRLTGAPVREHADFYNSYTRDARRPRQGSPVTDDHLRQVAGLYRAALDRRDPPTQTVGDTMHVGRSTAARWVSMARERGILGPALPGQAGEAHKP